MNNKTATAKNLADVLLKEWDDTENSIKLPSRYQIKDIVSIDFYDAGFIREAKVIKVHFSASKVLYDVELCIKKSPAGEKHNMYTRIYNVDSIHVKDFVQ